MEENRSFDHFFGFARKQLKVDGLTGTEFNLINRSDPARGKVTVAPGARYVNPCDPNHGTSATAAKVAGGTMAGFVGFEQAAGHGTKALNWCDVMESFEPDAIPIITGLAENFSVMDKMFCSHAGPTWPNRMFALSATSAGSTSTGTFYEGIPGRLFPQRTFFDQLSEHGLSWKNYYNDTPWELFLSTLAHSPENIAPLTELYTDAAAGTLPAYSWVNPRAGMNVSTGHGSNDQHPDHDVALGEALIKDIYEALRSGPGWNDTLFIITYDEHGGFYDHVSPPRAPAPGDRRPEQSYPDKGVDFTQLGVRIPTLLISPWIPAGTVLSAPPIPQKPAADSQYDLTSIMATARKLLGMDPAPLTDRDRWAATFEHVLSLDAPRIDCPVHLPAAPTPTLTTADEAALPLNDLQRDIAEVHAHVLGGPTAAADAAAVATKRQAEISDWLQGTYRAHAEQTASWRRSKNLANAAPRFNVVSRPPSMAGMKASFKINTAEPGVKSGTVTVSVAPGETVFCLEYRNVSGPATISACYPSVSPGSNRDPDQQWILESDSTIRPAGNPASCLTNVRFDSSYEWEVYNVSVADCDGRVEQHWAVAGGNPSDRSYGVGFASDLVLGLV